MTAAAAPVEILTEEELLAVEILIEECGEVLQAVGKARRFGLDSYNPEDPAKQTNRSRLEQELGDVISMTVYLEGLLQGVAESRAAYRLEMRKRGDSELLMVAGQCARLAQLSVQACDWNQEILGILTRSSVAAAYRDHVAALLAAVDLLADQQIVEREWLLHAAVTKQVKVCRWSNGRLRERTDGRWRMQELLYSRNKELA